jgi:hypothetical protein
MGDEKWTLQGKQPVGNLRHGQVLEEQVETYTLVSYCSRMGQWKALVQN